MLAEPQPDLVVTKTLDAPAPQAVGDPVSWTITVSNSGQRHAASGWTVTDVFDSGVSGLTLSGNPAEVDCSAVTSCVGLSETHNNVAVFSIGVNDSSIFHDGAQDRFLVSLEEFEENYEALLQKAKGFTLQTICVGLSPCDDNKAKRPYWAPNASWNNDRMRKFNRVASKVAKNNGVEFVEIFEVLQSANEEHELFPDGLHPNGIGHELIAATVLPVLEKYAN